MSEPKNIAIVGAGGFGKETVVMLLHINGSKRQWNIIGFYDDGLPGGIMVAGIPVLGKVQDLNTVSEELAVVVAVGDPKTKKSIVDRIQNKAVFFPSLVHPSATIGESINMGLGVVVTAGCRLTIDITLGDFVLLNLNTTVGHDVQIGSFTSVMPGVHLSGFVKVGEGALIGTGASLLQEVTLGDQCVVGAGAVVNKNVEPNRTVIGVPARPLNI